MKNKDVTKNHSLFQRTRSYKRVVSVRNNQKNKWPLTTLSNAGNYSGTTSNSSDLSSQNTCGPRNDGMKNNNSSVSAIGLMSRKLETNKIFGSSHHSIVTIVLVEAKNLPPGPEDGVTHNLYCKFRLGSESYKTKSVVSTVRPEWGERFILRLYKDDFLKISVRDKGKQKNFMGSCILDLSIFERDRTHEIWQELDDGYGQIHLSITICLSNTTSSLTDNLFNLENTEQPRFIYDLRSKLQLVGLLHVNIFGARGLIGISKAYCILELDNERVQTPKEGPSSDPTWNKCYMFNVYDVTSTLDLKVYGKTITSALLNEPIGKVSIPLLTIINGERRWYALKDKNKRYIAKGHCPRVHLQMTLTWNPIKASLRLFRPKAVKYVKKSKKLDIVLIHKNVEFIGKLFNILYEINESFKQLFEWDDPESSIIALISWIVFCFYFRLWTVPLLILIPFTYHWFLCRSQDNKYQNLRTYSDNLDKATKNNSKKDKGLSRKVQDLQHTTSAVINGVDYLVSVAERLYNLVSFKVPYLSYFAMIMLAITSLVFYFIPFNYLLMIVGIYKYVRKYLNPDRILNNDLLDFISRIPDNKILNDWKELSVPEPVQKQSASKLARSVSTEVLP